MYQAIIKTGASEINNKLLNIIPEVQSGKLLIKSNFYKTGFKNVN